MKFQLFKRLVVEDFDQASQTLIGKIATIYNPMIDQLNTGFNRNLDFTNFNQEVITFNVTVDSAGNPTSALQLSSTLKSSIKGVICMSATNTTDNTPLTGAPFVSFTRSSGTISIDQITGLASGKKYSIAVILIG